MGVTTVGMILQDDLANIEAQAVALLKHDKAVLRRPPLTRDTVFGQVQSSLASLQTVSISDLLKLAWSVSRTLRRAADESLATGRPQTFHLDGYAVPVDYRPSLDVFVGKKRIATVHFGLCVTLELFNIDGVVERAHLMRVQSHLFNVTASLSVESRTIASRQATLNLAVEFPIPVDGLPLRTATAASPTGTRR